MKWLKYNTDTLIDTLSIYFVSLSFQIKLNSQKLYRVIELVFCCYQFVIRFNSRIVFKKFYLRYNFDKE